MASPPGLGSVRAAPVFVPQPELADLQLEALAHHADRGGGAGYVAFVRAQRAEQELALEALDRDALGVGEAALVASAAPRVLRERGRQVGRLDLVAGREHGGLLDHVAQLARVAGPGVARERR